jgi:hypothetical protein
MRSPTLSFASALDGDGWSTPRPGRFTPGKDPVPIVKEAGRAPGPFWTGAELLSPIGIRSRTVQPVASRYTDYATPALKDRRYKRERSLYSTEGREKLKWVLNWQV